MGEALDTLRFRLNSYKNNNRNLNHSEIYMQEHLFRHVSSKGHNVFLNNASITFIDKTEGVSIEESV